jgi:Lrp/AsnC family transcriptional regulator for asnA, asnC and gidA
LNSNLVRESVGGCVTELMITDTEEAILRALLIDPRTPFSEIAKRSGVTTNTVRKQFKQLQDNGVITGSITQIYPTFFGYCCVSFLAIQTSIQHEADVLQFLKQMPEVLWSFSGFGKVNISCLVCLKSIDQLTATISRIRKNQYVTSLESDVWINTKQMDHPENLILRPMDSDATTSRPVIEVKKTKPEPNSDVAAVNLPELNRAESREKLDDVDLLIIKELTNDARKSFRTISKNVGVSTQSVIRRYERLKKEVLSYSSITVNLEKLGYLCTALFLVKISPFVNCDEVLCELYKIPNMIISIKLFGNVDALLAFPISDCKQVFELKTKIGSVLGVTEIELIIDRAFPSWPFNHFAQLTLQ